MKIWFLFLVFLSISGCGAETSDGDSKKTATPVESDKSSKSSEASGKQSPREKKVDAKGPQSPQRATVPITETQPESEPMPEFQAMEINVETFTRLKREIVDNCHGYEFEIEGDGTRIFTCRTSRAFESETCAEGVLTITEKDGLSRFDIEVLCSDGSTALLDTTALTLAYTYLDDAGDAVALPAKDISQQIDIAIFRRVESWYDLGEAAGLGGSESELLELIHPTLLFHDECQYRLSQTGSAVAYEGNCRFGTRTGLISVGGLPSLLKLRALIDFWKGKGQLQDTSGLSEGLRHLVELLRMENGSGALMNVFFEGDDYAEEATSHLTFQNRYEKITTERVLKTGYYLSLLKAAQLMEDPSQYITFASVDDTVALTFFRDKYKHWFDAFVWCGYERYHGTVCHGWAMESDFSVPYDRGHAHTALVAQKFVELGILDAAKKDRIDARRELVEQIANEPRMTKDEYGRYLEAQDSWAHTTSVGKIWLLENLYALYTNAPYYKLEMEDGLRWPIGIREASEYDAYDYYVIGRFYGSDIFDFSYRDSFYSQLPPEASVEDLKMFYEQCRGLEMCEQVEEPAPWEGT